jgi:hypothetical protein
MYPLFISWWLQIATESLILQEGPRTKPTDPQLVNIFPIIYEICKTITVFTRDCKLPPLTRITQFVLHPSKSYFAIFLIGSNTFNEIFFMVFMLSPNHNDQLVQEPNVSHTFKILLVVCTFWYYRLSCPNALQTTIKKFSLEIYLPLNTYLDCDLVTLTP